MTWAEVTPVSWFFLGLLVLAAVVLLWVFWSMAADWWKFRRR